MVTAVRKVVPILTGLASVNHAGLSIGEIAPLIILGVRKNLLDIVLCLW